MSTSFDVYFKLVQLGQHLMDADLSQVWSMLLLALSALRAVGLSFTNAVVWLAVRDLSSQADIPAALDNLRQRYPQFLPSNERVTALAGWDKVTSLSEYLAIYDDPIELVQESDLVWPAPPPLLY